MRVTLEAEALADAAEFLEQRRAEGDELTYAGIVQSYGPPAAVARRYHDCARETGAHFEKTRYRHAPGWHLTCLGCGCTGELQRTMLVGLRWLSWSLLQLTVGYCTECRRLRLLRVWKARSM